MSHDKMAHDLLENAAPLLERMLTTLTVGVVVADARADDLPLTYVNPAFERLTGYPAAESLGRNCRFLQGEDTDRDALAEIRAAIDQSRPAACVLRNYRRDGTPFWNEIRIAPIPGPDGRAAFFLGLVDDVSLRVESEQRLHAAERRYRSLIEQLPMVAYTARRTDRTRLSYVSPQIQDLTGFAPEDWLGDSDLWYQRLHPDDRDRVIAAERAR